MRQRILDAAARLFSRDGFLRVTMDDVASEASITKRTLYRHIPSKDALVEAVVDQHMERGTARFSALLEADAPARVRLESVVRFLGEQAAAVDGRLVEDLQTARPDLYARILAFRRERLGRLVALLEAEQEQGRFPADLSVPVVVEMLMVSVEHFSSPERMRRGDVAWSQALKTVFGVVLAGLDQSGPV